MGFKSQAIKGVAWSAIERVSVQGVQFIISVILARLLSPSDFGLVALVLVVLNILQVINEEGFGVALIHKLDRDELDFSSVFVLNIVLGVSLYGALYILAPVIAHFFEQPHLTYYTRIIGLNLIISSLVVVQRTKLEINIDFKTQAKASLISVIISGFIGISCAYKGLGTMSLVLQSLVNNGLNAFLLWYFVKWWPKLQFSYKRFVELYKFAYKLILSRLINTIFQQAYSAIIGKVYSPDQLGYFNRANALQQLSSNNITGIVQRVSTPILCGAQKDHQQIGILLTKFIASTALIVYPLLFGLFVLAEPLISVLLTDKWLPSVWMLKVLCPVGLLYVISTFNRNVFNATGRTDWALKSEVIKKIIFVIIIAIAIKFGLIALILSQVLIAIVESIIATLYTKKQIGLTLLEQLKSVSIVFIASLIMAIIVWVTILFFDSNIVKLIIGTFIGTISYLSICYMFNISIILALVEKLKKHIQIWF